MRININGNQIEVDGVGVNISVNDDTVSINGKKYEGKFENKNIKLIIEGGVANITSDRSVDCGEVKGNVDCGGSVNAGGIGGDITCGGSVNCGKVGGSISAGGSVISR